jgi:hypothetical protein
LESCCRNDPRILGLVGRRGSVSQNKQSTCSDRDKADKKSKSKHGLGRDMQWYVYLITISAAAFLIQSAFQLLKSPTQTVLRVRRLAIGRMHAIGKTSLPQPRELAISSMEIREYDQAIRNVREAERTFCDLGTRLLALSESEPVIRIVMGMYGLDIFAAGQALIHLSEVCARAKTDSEDLRHEIAKAVRKTSTALAISRDRSRDNLFKLQLEPMDLCRAAFPRQRFTTGPT